MTHGFMMIILIIDDNTCEAKHASAFAFAMAQRMEGEILLAHTTVAIKIEAKVIAGECAEEEECEDYYIANYLRLLNEQEDHLFKPKIEEIDISRMDESEVAGVINRNHIWMMIKGIPDEVKTTTHTSDLNVQIILNKVLCPLLLIPERWQLKNIERVVYIADLRYCRIQIVKYLAEVAKQWQADLSIVHISAKGLPDMAEKYALSVFTEEVCVNIDYDRLFLNNIKGGDITKAVDVIIHAMHNDILAVVNHRFHFEEIIGRYIGDRLPGNITVPLLIFPY
jgi:hypothetical protein